MSTLNSQLSQALNGDRPTVVMFYQADDAHCQEQMPVTREAADKLAGMAHFFEIDAAQHDDLRQKYHIHAYPTFILFVDGQEAWRATGRTPESELSDMVKRFA